MPTKTTPFIVEEKGNVTFSHNYGYMLQRCDTVAVFYIDTNNRNGNISYTSNNPQEHDIPEIGLVADENDESFTVISFPEFPGWGVHSAVMHKNVLSVALADWRNYGD